VTEAGWKGFEENIEKARQHLLEAWKINPKYPEAASRMITVAMVTAGNEEVLTWLDRALAAQVDYEPAYSFALNALRPRWGGSHELTLAMGDRAVATKCYGTNVPVKLFWAAKDIADDADGDWSVPLAMPGLYDKLKAMFDGYAEANPARTSWANSYKAALAWRLNRWDEAREFVDKAGKDIDVRCFTQLGGTANALREIAAHGP
jgi:tetratricopeptide (TPR) repeat protein